MKISKVNLFKITDLYLAKKVVFGFKKKTIKKNVFLDEHKNDLKITNVLFENICDEIFEKKCLYEF